MLTLKVIPDDGDPYKLVAGSRQIMLWESTGRNNTLARLNDNPSMADFYFIGHLAAVKAGKFTGSLEQFKDSVDIEMIPPSEDGESPTLPGHIPG